MILDPNVFAQDLAVIPIVVNAGAAAAPALIAGLASAIGLLFKPRQLFAALRRRPLVALVVIAGFGGVIFLATGGWGKLMPAAPVASPVRGGQTVSPGGMAGVDWSEVALELLRQEARGGVQVRVPAPAEPSAEGSAQNSFDFRGGVQRTGYLGGTAPRHLTKVWEYSPETALFLTSPALRDGVLYTASTYLDAGKSYGEIIALDAATGERLWITDVAPSNGKPFAGFFSSPSLSADGSKLVIGQGLHPDTHMDLICLDTAPGEALWLANTTLHLESSPVIADGMVLVGAGAIESEKDKKPIGDPGYVFAVDLETGTELWRHPVADPESSGAVEDGVLFIGSGFNGAAVVALRIDPETPSAERLKWRQDTPYPATGAVSLAGDLVLIGCGKSDFIYEADDPEGYVLAFDKESGELRWKTRVSESVLGSIAVRDGRAIASVRDGKVIALSLEEGRVLWETEISPNAPVLAGCAVTDPWVYAVSADGYLFVLDVSTGREVERIYINAENNPGGNLLSIAPPLVADGVLYTGSETGGVRAYVDGGSPDE
jgi:outer membrane protein assembly factor BamB